MKLPHHAAKSLRATRSNRRRRYYSRIGGILATNIAVLLGLQTMNAATYYWDTNGSTPGSGAATGTWDGTTANWTTDSTGSITPTVAVTTALDDVIFSAGTNGTTGTVTVSGAQLVNSITFANNVGITISGGTSITLGGEGSNSGITVASGDNATNTISTAIILDPSTTALGFTNNGAGLLTLGALTGSAVSGTQTLTVDSTSGGGITLSGIIGNGAGGGTVALVINNSGSGITTLSGVNTFTGGTTISGGTVNVSNNLNLGAAASAVTLNGGTLNATNGFTNTHVVTIGAAGGTINVGGNAVQQVYFHTASTLTGSGPLTITNTSGNIGNDVRVDTAQTGYTGNIILQKGGVFEFGVANAVNSTATFTVNSTGELVVNSGVTSANAITIANGGTIGFENGTTGAYSGTITLTGGTATIGLRDYYTFTTARGGTISGKITGAGGLLITAGGASGGTLTLSGANDFSGAVTVNNSTVTVNGTSGTINGASSYALYSSTLVLDNTSGNVDRLKDTAAVTMTSSAGLTLTGNATTNTTETVGALAIASGNSTITIGSQTGRVTTLAGASLSRSGNATALIRGTSLNQSVTANVSRLTLADGGASLTQVGTNTLSNGGTADTTQALKIVPYLFGDTSTTGNGSNFVTYDSTLGFRVLLTTEQTTLTAAYTTAANPDNAIAFNGVLSTTSGVTLNSLLFNTATQTLDGSGGSLAVNSGAVASTSTADVIGSNLSALVLGNGEGVVTVTSGSALTINTPINVTSSGGLTKAGAGTLTLGAVNIYTGQTTIDQGTLAVTAGVNDVLNSTTGTALQVNNGATFNTNASTQKITTLTLTGNAIVTGTSGVLDLGGTVTYDTSTNPGPGATISVTTLDLNGTQTFNIGKSPVDWNPNWTVTGPKELTISSAIVNGSGTGGITKNGAGVLALTGAGASNTFSGPTTVNAGTLYLVASAAGIPNSAVTVNPGATFAAQLSNGSNSGSNGTSPLTTVASSLTLNGASAIFGGNENPNSASGRALRYGIANALALASGASTVSLNNGTVGNFGSTIEFGSLVRSAGATVLFRAANLGTGSLRNNSGNNGIVFNTSPAGQAVGGGGASGTNFISILPYAIGDSGAYTATTNFNLTSGLGTDFVFYNGGSIQLVNSYATSINSGTATFNNVKITDTAVTGIDVATTVNSLILNSASASAGGAGTTSVDGVGTLTINSGAILVTTTTAASAAGGTIGNYGGLYTNNATIGASGLILDFGSQEGIVTIAGTSTLTVAGAITGSGGLTKSGAGLLTLSATNSYTGTTIVNADTLKVTGSGTLGGISNGLTVQAGGIVDLGGTAQGVGALNGAGTIFNSTASSTSTLTVGNGNATGSYAGVIADNGGTGGVVALTKTGTGTQTLTGASTYSGATTVSAGELIVKGSLNGTVNANVASGASLASGTTGSIATATGGNISVSGTLAPGDFGSVGTLSLAPGTGGKLSFLSGSTYDFTISGSTSDSVSFSTVGDWLTGGGNVTLNLTGITAGNYGNTYTVFHNVSTSGFTVASITGYDSVDYAAHFTRVGNDYDLTFTAIPEPSMPISLLGGAGVLVLLRRRTGKARA